MAGEAILQVGAIGAGLVSVPTPSSMTIGLMDVDASTTKRTADGTIHRDRICGAASAKRKIELEWSYPAPAAAKTILQAFKDEFFNVRYFDPYEAAMRTATFYAGDRSVPMYSANLRGGVRWESVKFNIIEK